MHEDQQASTHSQLGAASHAAETLTQWMEAIIRLWVTQLLPAPHALQSATSRHSVAGMHGPQQPSTTLGTWPLPHEGCAALHVTSAALQLRSSTQRLAMHLALTPWTPRAEHAL